uniref:Uncharacterized protein n=1 Tax=Loa loa TaxID=7209 RepID=A0A1I7VXH3_LOALO
MVLRGNEARRASVMVSRCMRVRVGFTSNPKDWDCTTAGQVTRDRVSFVTW